MGTVAIGGIEKYNDRSKEERGGDVNLLDALPEGCIAVALSLTSPRDACRLSLVATNFRSAAKSDVVWERFLPPDWAEIVARSSTPSVASDFVSKKDLFLHLCDHPIIIDDGAKSFSLDKSSGIKCYMIAARDLSIVWADTPRYWNWTSHPDSRFPEVVELVDVCWLEIQGKISTCILSPDITYAAYFVFKFTSTAYGFVYQPAEVSVGISGGESQTRTVYLDPDGKQRHGYLGYHITIRPYGMMNLSQPAPEPREGNGQNAKQRGDGWMEVELGEYTNKGERDGELEMRLMEVKGGNWKSGLIVQGIEIRPKYLN